jgi:hypothetical protein
MLPSNSKPVWLACGRSWKINMMDVRRDSKR